MAKKFYGKGIPGQQTADLKGTLLVIEGGDGAGRSTQIMLLRQWLEREGYPTTEVGLKRSVLVGQELQEVMQGNTLGPTTFSLFYATDFADQLENTIIPSLRAGFVVLADRYIYTPIARDVVRGVDPNWVRDLYGMALEPDLVVYLKATPKTLASRSFQKSGTLDYWEAGMDIQRSGDMYQCFIRYQTWVAKEFKRLAEEYAFETIDANRHPITIHNEIRAHVLETLKPSRKVAASAS